MNIKSTIRSAKVDAKHIQEAQALVEHKHDIAWLSAIDSKVRLQGKPALIGYKNPSPFFTYDINASRDQKTFHEYLLLGQQGLDYIGTIFPETLDRPISAMTLLVDSSSAYQKWIDPQTELLEKGLATGKVLMSGFDAFKPYFPVMNQISGHMQSASLVLKIADSVYILCKEDTL